MYHLMIAYSFTIGTCSHSLGYSRSHHFMRLFSFQTVAPEGLLRPIAAAPTTPTPAPAPAPTTKEGASGAARLLADSSAISSAETMATVATPSTSNPTVPGAAATSAPTLAGGLVGALAGGLVGGLEAAEPAMVDLPSVVGGRPLLVPVHAQPLGLAARRGVELACLFGVCVRLKIQANVMMSGPAMVDF